MTTYYILLLIFGFLISFIITPLAHSKLKKSGFTVPSESRSMHSGIALRGLGVVQAIAIIFPATLAMWLFFPLQEESFFATLISIFVIAGFSILGFIDDYKELSAKFRFTIQCFLGFVIGISIFLNSQQLVLAIIFSIFTVIVFVNTHNFMDGIDGITSLHAMLAGLFFSAVSFAAGNFYLVFISLLVVVVFAGFLPWNLLKKGWFLGDSGSYLLGGTFAVVFLTLLGSGINPLILIGPFVPYLSDVFFTILRRFFEGKNILHPHRSHVYQNNAIIFKNHILSASVVILFSFLSSLAALMAEFKIVPISITTFSYVVVSVLYINSSKIFLLFKSMRGPKS
jgi:UDP-N-acetylmuramyl pentapeptide phosphotransferase/UDP-N-acetylglucosamine-1-phosphate transferase